MAAAEPPNQPSPSGPSSQKNKTVSINPVVQTRTLPGIPRKRITSAEKDIIRDAIKNDPTILASNISRNLFHGAIEPETINRFIQKEKLAAAINTGNGGANDTQSQGQAQPSQLQQNKDGRCKKYAVTTVGGQEEQVMSQVPTPPGPSSASNGTWNGHKTAASSFTPRSIMKYSPRPVKSLSLSSATGANGVQDEPAWSDKEKRMLRYLRATDTSWAVIAETLNRSYNACRQQYVYLLGKEALEKEDQEKQDKCSRCHRARPRQEFFDGRNMPRAHCKSCVKKIIGEEASKPPIKRFIQQAAKVVKQKDLEWNGKRYATTLKAFQEAAVQAYGDTSKICPYCQRGLSFIEEDPVRGHQAALDPLSDGPARDAKPSLQWICHMCAGAKDHHSEEEFYEFLKLVQDAPEKHSVVTVPKDELAVLDYFQQELAEKDRQTMTMTRPDGQPVHYIGTTATVDELRALVTQFGIMDRYSRIRGSWNTDDWKRKLVFVQKFDRIPPQSAMPVEEYHLCYASNLEVMLFPIHQALGNLDVTELKAWIEAIKARVDLYI